MSVQDFPFEKQQIREALNPIDVQKPVPDLLPIKRYRLFYGLDFEKKIKDVTASMGVVKVAGYDIVCQTFTRDLTELENKGTIFVFHGLYDHVGIFDKPIGYFLEQGYSVVAYDLPGHGLSSGGLVAISNFYRYQQILIAVYSALKAQLPNPFYAVAQSTGGAVLIDSLLNQSFANKGYPFAKTVLLAPLVRPRNWLRNKSLHTVLSPFFDYVPRGFSVNSHDSHFLKFLKNEDRLQSHFLSSQWVGALKKWVPKIESANACDNPVLIIQGQEDETVDWEHNISLLKTKLTNLNVAMFISLRHQVVNEIESIRNEVFGKALEFIESDYQAAPK